jgi:hypothetical protein
MPQHKKGTGAMTRIGSSAANAIGATSGGGGTSAGAMAGSLMSGLAGKMAQNIGSALNLVGNDASDAWQGNPNDPYEIAELVAGLGEDVAGNPAEAGELTRALHSFVQESAVLFAARPQSSSLARLNAIIARVSINGGSATYSALTQKVDTATQSLLAEAA